MWEILGQVADTLDAPRRGVYSLGNKVAQSMGYTGPEIKNFSDLLVQGLGADPDSITTSLVGGIGDVLTDPLSYAGYPLAAGFRNLVGNVGRAAYTNPGRSSKWFATTDWEKFAKPLNNTTFVRDAEIRPVAMSDIHQLPATPSGRTRMYMPGDQAGTVNVFEADVRPPRVSNYNAPRTEMLRQTNTVGRGNIEPMLDPYIGGYYEIPTDSVFLKSNRHPLLDETVTRRHETIHAIINNASQDPSLRRNLPLSMRIPASLLSSSNRDLRTLGTILDEMAATSLSNRSPWTQMGSAINFLINPTANRGYYRSYVSDPTLSRFFVDLYGALPEVYMATGTATPAVAQHFARQMRTTDE